MSVLNFGINSNWVRFALCSCCTPTYGFKENHFRTVKKLSNHRRKHVKLMCCICRKDFSRSIPEEASGYVWRDKEERKEIEVAIGSLVEHRVTITAPLSLLVTF